MSDEPQPASTATAADQHLFDVGARLRGLREERGLSQRELARRAGMTNANLSMIEQGRVSPAIATLEKILQALPIPLSEFFSPSATPTPIVMRAGDFTLLRRGDSEYRVLHPSPGSDAPYLALQTLAPGASLSGTWLDRTGWICGVVQRGELSLSVDNCHFLVRSGEGFQFHLKRHHQFANMGEAPLEITLVVSSQGGGRGKKV